METATAATVAATTNAAALISLVGASQRCGAQFLRDFLDGKDGSWGTPQTSPNSLSSWWFGT